MSDQTSPADTFDILVLALPDVMHHEPCVVCGGNHCDYLITFLEDGAVDGEAEPYHRACFLELARQAEQSLAQSGLANPNQSFVDYLKSLLPDADTPADTPPAKTTWQGRELPIPVKVWDGDDYETYLGTGQLVAFVTTYAINAPGALISYGNAEEPIPPDLQAISKYPIVEIHNNPKIVMDASGAIKYGCRVYWSVIAETEKD